MLADDYLAVVLFIIIALSFPPITYFLTRFFRSSREEADKEETYECGELPEGDARIQFNFQYYIFALIFVVFDVIVVFLICWAVSFSSFNAEMKVYATMAIILFIAALLAVVYHSLRRERRIWI